MGEIQAVIRQQAGSIECNFEQVKEGIRERLEEYRGAIVTEEGRVIAKKELASLRAEQKRFRDSLRDAKKEYMRPWDSFEEKAKPLIALYDEPIRLINGQIQELERGRAEEKKRLVQSVYEELVPEGLRSYLPLGRIYNPRWENATMKEKEIRGELQGLVESARKGILTIQGTGSGAVEKALSMYRENLDLTGALNYINAYEHQRQEIEGQEQGRRRLEEEERIRREERERLMLERRAQEEKEAALRLAEEEKAAALRRAKEEKAEEVARARKETAQEVIDSLIPEFFGEARMYEYRMPLTADAKEKVDMYLDSVGIAYEAEEITGW